MLAVSVLGFVFAPQLVAVFRDDPEVVAIGTRALRFQCVTFCLQGWVVMSNMCQQTMGLTTPATFLAVARQGLFFVPLVWLFSALWGLTGYRNDSNGGGPFNVPLRGSAAGPGAPAADMAGT